MEDMYLDGTYLKKNPTWHAEDSPWKAAGILKMIYRNKLQPKLVCEVGCGAGEVLRCLSRNFNSGAEFHGFEIAKDAFINCLPKRAPNLKFFLMDVTRESNELFYDLVLAIDVIEHVEDYFGFLRKIKGKGRYKIFHIPLDVSVMSILNIGAILNVREKCGHIHYFTKDLALHSLNDAGYDIIDSFYTYRSLELGPKSVMTLAARLPRWIMFRVHQDFGIRLLGGASLMVLAQ